jgi:hypothetical protein
MSTFVLTGFNIFAKKDQHFFLFFASASSNSVHPEGALAAGWG